MNYICEWGSAVQNMTPEAKRLLAEYRAERNDLERRKSLKRKFYDIVDTRLFCIVFNCHDNSIRHIVRVTDDAESHLQEFMQEYYKEYNEFPTDRFYFYRGYHRVSDFADWLATTEFTIEKFEKTYNKIKAETDSKEISL